MQTPAKTPVSVFYFAGAEAVAGAKKNSRENIYPDVSKTPAWSLFSIFCHNLNVERSSYELCSKTMGKGDDSEMAPPDPILIRWNDYYSVEEPPSVWQRTIELLSIGKERLIQGLYSEEEYDDKTRRGVIEKRKKNGEEFLPIGYITASELSKAQFINNEKEVNGETLKAIRLLQNKFVLVGYFLGNGIDIIVTPIHGAIPGVFNHAMALDNLIQLDDSYWHMPEEDVVMGLDMNDVIELAMTFFCILIVVYVRYKQKDYEYISNLICIVNSDVSKKKKEISKIYLKAAEVEDRRLVILFFVPVALMSLSLVISQYIYVYGMANWYTLPIIFIFSLPVFLTLILNIIRVRFVMWNFRNKKEQVGVRVYFINMFLNLRMCVINKCKTWRL